MILRDAQVTPIWEGTTNILSLDVLRAVAKSEGQVLQAYHGRIQSVLNQAGSSSALDSSCQLLEQARSTVLSFASRNPDRLQYHARDFAFGLARSLAGALLLEHACWAGASDSDRAAASRWLSTRDLLPASISATGSAQSDVQQQEMDESLVYDGYSPQNLLSPLF